MLYKSERMFLIVIETLMVCFVLESTAFPYNHSRNWKRKRESDISFPGDDYDNEIDYNDGLSYDAVRPFCRDGSTFCEEVENYPASLIETVLAREPEKYEKFFGADAVVPPQVLAGRFGHTADVELLCNSQETLIFPKSGLTHDDTWKFIVNHKNYVQGVRVETCIHTSECSLIGHFPLGFLTRCKQKYIYRQLLAINMDGTTTKSLFKVPCCCECVLYRHF